MTSTRNSFSKPDTDDSGSLLLAMLQAYPGDWVQVLDGGARCLLALGQGLETIGPNPADLIGKTPHAIYAPDLAGDITAASARALAGEALEFDCTLGDRQYALTVSPQPDRYTADGRVILVARDITEHKRTAWRLNEVQRIANVGDWEWDPRTDAVTWSDELYRILGLDPTEPPPDYQGNLALYRPEDARKLDAAVRAALEQGHQPYSLEMRRLRPDGRAVVIQARGEAERDATGAITRLYGTALDITAIKEAERKAQQAYRHVLEILESTTDAFFEVDTEFRVTYMNAKALQAMGFAASEESLGRNLWDLFPQAVETIFYREYHRAMREREIVAFEGYFDPFDAWYEVHAYPSSKGLSVYFQVVTERKRTERQLQIATEKAVAANAAKSAFLANMSHEIRTPLNGVMGMLNLIAMTDLTDLTDEQREYAELAVRSTQRLTRLLSDILDLSRIEAGYLTLSREPFELAEVLDALQQIFKPAATRKGIELLVSLDPKPPPAPAWRRDAPAPDSWQSGRQRDQIHAARTGVGGGHRPRQWPPGRAADALHREGYRRRHGRGTARRLVRALPAGRESLHQAI